MKHITLKRKILAPLTLTLGVLLCALMFNDYHNHQKEFSRDIERRLRGVQELFDKQLNSEIELLNAIIEMVSVNHDLQKAWLAGDREMLLQVSSPLLKQLGAKHRITHFYFHSPDQTNFLRVYDPKRFGDKINRFTLREAVRTGQDSAGIELGKMGTMTLRTVHPWRVDNKIVGYIEMGEEVDHIIAKLHNILDVEIYVSIYKEYLDQNKWEAGMQLLGRPSNWDFSPYAVIVSQSLPNLPRQLKNYIGKGKHEYMEMATGLALSLNKRSYRVGVVPFFDVGGQEIGDIIILHDVTATLTSFTNNILLVGSICAVVGLLLFMLFSTYLGKLEATVSIYQNNLEQMVEERTRDLSEAVREIKALRGIIPICMKCKQIRDDAGIWNQVDAYISRHSEAEFSHGICPQCAEKHYPDLYDRVKNKFLSS